MSAKRGRGRSRKEASEEVQSAKGDVEEDEDEEDSNPRKKTRAASKQVTQNGSSSKAGRKSLTALAEETDRDGDVMMVNGDESQKPSSFTNMKALRQHNNLKDWEDIVEDISTVEKVGDELMVFFKT